MDLYFRKAWNDPRLVYDDGPKQINLSPQVAQKYVWIPDMFFSNSRDTSIHETLKPDYGVRLKANGDVLCSAR